jgi:signal recognition particle subunit SRP19
MSRNARIEEVSDSDPDEMDIDEIMQNTNSSLINPTSIPSSSSTSEPQLRPQFRAPTSGGPDQEKIKHWQCVYPIYFDGNRTRAEGRRVGKDEAVENPLAREIVDACQSLGLNIVFEPGKTHPKDWANPGRVRVLLKENGKNMARNVKNSKPARPSHKTLSLTISRASSLQTSLNIPESTSRYARNSTSITHNGFTASDRTTTSS